MFEVVLEESGYLEVLTQFLDLDYLQLGLDYLQLGLDYLQLGLDYLQLGLDYLQLGLDYLQLGLDYLQLGLDYLQSGLDLDYLLMIELVYCNLQVHCPLPHIPIRQQSEPEPPIR